ncbi:MAG TPA: prepilin-type N-terminal cleavage/methylation domain-containing protein [Candidatus Saccharimonadales bacterium]|jgi:Tfp pilus assembly protein FimT|nr:prepilin-type N-terminal cleavage/methylation domain-containing protein [Candidatus Saccharimonadales bacterium]
MRFERTRLIAGTRSPEANASRGFSLVELVIAVVIIITIAGIAIPKVVSVTQDARMANDIRSISAQIFLARMRAASAGAKSRLNFNTSTNSYQIEVWNGSSWAIYGGTINLNTGDTFGYGTITAPAGQQSTIAQTTPIYFNSRGMATDSSGSATANSAIYFTNIRNQYAAIAVSIAGQPTSYTYSGSAWVQY